MLGDQRRSATARGILSERRARALSFPSNLFGEYAWAILLQLFVAAADNQTLTEADVVHRLDGPASVIKAWLRHLSAVSLVVVHDRGT